MQGQTGNLRFQIEVSIDSRSQTKTSQPLTTYLRYSNEKKLIKTGHDMINTGPVLHISILVMNVHN